MGDISTWNPVDNSNTTAPPDGWPEGMAPSAVNNSARAMMGAVRRWYDTVTAQLSGMLPLTGGTLTGPLTAPTITSTGNINASGNIVASNDLGGHNLNLSGNVNAGLGTVTAATVTSAGNINASGNIVAVVDLGGRDLNLARNANVPGALAVGAAASAQGYQARSGTPGPFQGNYFNIDWVGAQAHLWIDNVNLGPLAVAPGGTIATTTINASGTVTGGQVTSTGNANVAGTMTAGSVHATGNLQVDASATINNSLYVGGPVTFQNTFDVTGGPCSNVDGTWHVISDARMKTGIADYKPGLEAILALRPCIYRYRPELFGPEEAEKTRYGLVADEVAPVLPEMVGEAVFGGRHLSTLNTGPLNFVLINACRDLAAQNAALAARITALEETHV